jgi:hypothetical protein
VNKKQTNMKEKILEILKNTLPENTNIIIRERKGVFSGKPELMVGFSVGTHLINGVSDQYPQFVSLWLKLDTMEFTVQSFGGCGGGRIYRKPDMNNPNEKYLAMVGVKIPFRKPKPNEEAVLGAVERFAQNWLKALKDNIDVLQYSQYVDYKEYLKDVV